MLTLFLTLMLARSLFLMQSLVAPAFWDAAGVPTASQRRTIGVVALG